jgi:hypothetical protein
LHFFNMTDTSLSNCQAFLSISSKNSPGKVAS